MTTEYRVRYKKGDIEVEVQSGDKEYVNTMLEKLLAAAPRHHEAPPPAERRAERGGPRKQRPRDTTDTSEPESTVDAAVVANRVNEADNHELIEKNILNKASRLAKILLAFHFAHECGFDQLTSGDVEKITDQLGIKVEQSNASHCISDNRKLFSAGATRRKGAKVPYKLNRQGGQAYKTVLESGKI